MKTSILRATLNLVVFMMLCAASHSAVIFETTSPYHHILVVDQQGVRTLSFDRSAETRMTIQNPLTGHFEYTEYFHMPLLWNPEMKNVLMIGLGGASTQRSFLHYYPEIAVETVELDPMVVEVAKKYFFLRESTNHLIHVMDGRLALRRSQKRYDSIILDAYVSGRYGSHIPHHLVSKEFFVLASDHLSTNGVLAYNVMGSLSGWQENLLGAVYNTMKTVFPQVYMFPATESMNIVLIGTKATERVTLQKLQQRAEELSKMRRLTLPTFRTRMLSFRRDPPPASHRSPVLTDDFAPVEGLLKSGEP